MSSGGSAGRRFDPDVSAWTANLGKVCDAVRQQLVARHLADEPADVQSAPLATGAQTVAWYGVRIFTDRGRHVGLVLQHHLPRRGRCCNRASLRGTCSGCRRTVIPSHTRAYRKGSSTTTVKGHPSPRVLRRRHRGSRDAFGWASQVLSAGRGIVGGRPVLNLADHRAVVPGGRTATSVGSRHLSTRWRPRSYSWHVPGCPVSGAVTAVGGGRLPGSPCRFSLGSGPIPGICARSAGEGPRVGRHRGHRRWWARWPCRLR